MAKIFRGATPAARPLSRDWSIMKLILRFSTSIIKDWSGPPSLQVSPRIKLLAGHLYSNGSTTLYIRSKHSGAELIVVDIHRSSDEGLNVRNPHALQLADSVNSAFHPGGQHSDYPPGDGGSGMYLLLALGTPTFTAFDGDNTAAAQQPANVLPELLRWLCFTGYGYNGITVRLRSLVGDIVQQHLHGEHHQNNPHQATVPRDFHHAQRTQQDHCRHQLSKGSLRVQELSSSFLFSTQTLAVLSLPAVTNW